MLVAIGAFGAVQILLGGGTALATVLTSPFGPTAAFRVEFGRNSQGTAQVAVWQRLSDGACAFTTIGNSAGLWDNYLIAGSSGPDYMWVHVGNDSRTLCSFSMKGLVYNGHILDLAGGGGNDTLISSNGDTWISGEEGNDGMIFSGFGVLSGGNGNDSVSAMSTVFTGETLLGGSGNDCLEDANAAAKVFNCGAGTDTMSTVHGVPMSIECEIQLSTDDCP
jgi:Ca2+-binding RTX toxin-like protein